MIDFGARLPQLRRRLKQDLALPGLPRNKVLAVVVKLLDETLIRVGNEEYARTNKSYGLTTLRDKHVRLLRDGRASFMFRGKSGRRHEVVLDDRRLVRIIRHCQQLPGQQLFQYVDDDGRRQPIDSGMVNDYLREAMGDNGEGFTAKDFRTWGATVRAIAVLSCRDGRRAVSDRAFNQAAWRPPRRRSPRRWATRPRCAASRTSILSSSQPGAVAWLRSSCRARRLATENGAHGAEIAARREAGQDQAVRWTRSCDKQDA